MTLKSLGQRYSRSETGTDIDGWFSLGNKKHFAFRSPQGFAREGRLGRVPTDAMHTIVVRGGELSRAISLILNRLRGISGNFRVLHSPYGATLDAAALTAGDIVLFEHSAEERSEATLADASVGRLSFPRLECASLWPFECANPYNHPEPRLPSGRFPYGNSFIIAALNQGIDPDIVLRHYLHDAWGASWPDLDRLRERDFATMQASDLQCDVQIAPYIADRFTERRLFWNAMGPANELLCELIARILDQTLAPQRPASRKVLLEVLYHFGSHDIFGEVSDPIHPHVAKHFSLRWYDRQESHRNFDKMFAYDEYFKEMVRQAQQRTPYPIDIHL